MGTLERVADIKHDVEAAALHAALEEEGIPHALQSHFDGAYSSVLQLQEGWGVVLAPVEHAARVQEVLATLRKGENRLSEGD